jgi:hypothetical protein
MSLEKLELYLARGNAFGANVDVKNKGCLAWVVLTKRMIAAKGGEVFGETENQRLLQEEMRIGDRPYHVVIAELPRSFYNNTVLPKQDDYLVNKSFLFKSLEEVQVFLAGMNIDIHEMKWSSDVKFV